MFLPYICAFCFQNGPVQFVSGSKVPFPKAQHDEAKSTTSKSGSGEHPDSDEDFEIIDFPDVPRQPLQSNRDATAPEMLPFPGDALSEVEEPNISLSEPGVVLGQNPMTKKAAEDKQFVRFMYPPSQPFPSTTKTVNDADLQDILAAAQAAAETAERSSTAARSAASLAQLRITELVKRKNDDFSSSNTEKTEPNLEEEAELDADNPFADSITPFTSPGRNNTSENSMTNQPMTHESYYDDAKGGFDSYPDKSNGFSYGSHHRPQRLPSMDDETYFSYPNLFTSQGSKP